MSKFLTEIPIIPEHGDMWKEEDGRCWVYESKTNFWYRDDIDPVLGLSRVPHNFFMTIAHSGRTVQTYLEMIKEDRWNDFTAGL